MSVTFASGIIATFLVKTPEVSKIRCEVTTKNSVAQFATLQSSRPKRTSQASHTTRESTPYLCRIVALSTAAASRPASASRLGPRSSAGCLRVVITCCSLGRRYLLTDAGPVVLLRVGTILGSERGHEPRQ